MSTSTVVDRRPRPDHSGDGTGPDPLREVFVPLTPDERRRLRDIERQLARDDPTFATSMGGHEAPPEGPFRRRALWWSLAPLAAMAAAVVVAFVVDVSYAAIILLFMLAASAFLRIGLRGRARLDPPDDFRHRDT